MVIGFYCKDCGLDQDLPVEMDSKLYYFAWCRGEDEDGDECGEKLVRYKVNRHLDPYFHESEKIKMQRRAYRIDLLQPGEKGFKLHYKDSWDKMEERLEMEEKKKLVEKKRVDDFTKEFGYNKTVKALEAEERIRNA